MESLPPGMHAQVVDCIGPCMIKLCGGKEIKLLALTTINVSTNMLEIDYFSTTHPQNVLIASKMVGCQDTHCLSKSYMTTGPNSSATPSNNSSIKQESSQNP